MDKIKLDTNSKDRTPEFEENDIKQNKAMGILSYISFLVLVPLFGAQYSKFARFNANQGLVLLIAEVVIAILRGIFVAIFSRSFTMLMILSWMFFVAELLPIYLSISGIINVCQGKAVELPLIGNIKILK